MNRAEQILEFDKIKNIWMTFALTDVAKKQIEAMRPTLDETELTVWQRQTTEAKLMMEKCGTPPLTSFAGMREILASAEKESCLTAEQLEVVATNLTAIRRLKDYLNRMIYRLPTMKKIWKVAMKCVRKLRNKYETEE